MNIIIRMPNWIGDLVMATPILADVRTKFPSASITAMCQRPLSDLLTKDPSINEIFCFTKPANGFLRRDDLRDIISKIAVGKYDIGILLTNSFSSAWWFWNGGVKRRIGSAKSFRSWLLTDPVKIPQKGEEHEVISYKRLLEPLGIPISSTAPRLFFAPSEVKISKQLLFQRGYIEGRPLVGINVGASYGSAKCWPPDKFRALAVDLLCEKNIFLVFFGGAETASLVKEIVRGLSPRAIDIAGVTSLRELGCLIQDCNLLVSNDSGPMHMAAAVGTPLIALFGSTEPLATGPYGVPESIIHKRPPCSPCFKRVCPLEDFPCMQEISVEEVAAKARVQLRKVSRV
jgi:heptosyltransferase-2